MKNTNKLTAEMFIVDDESLEEYYIAQILDRVNDNNQICFVPHDNLHAVLPSPDNIIQAFNTISIVESVLKFYSDYVRAFVNFESKSIVFRWCSKKSNFEIGRIQLYPPKQFPAIILKEIDCFVENQAIVEQMAELSTERKVDFFHRFGTEHYLKMEGKYLGHTYSLEYGDADYPRLTIGEDIYMISDEDHLLQILAPYKSKIEQQLQPAGFDFWLIQRLELVFAHLERAIKKSVYKVMEVRIGINQDSEILIDLNNESNLILYTLDSTSDPSNLVKKVVLCMPKDLQYIDLIINSISTIIESKKQKEEIF